MPPTDPPAPQPGSSRPDLWTSRRRFLAQLSVLLGGALSAPVRAGAAAHWRKQLTLPSSATRETIGSLTPTELQTAGALAETLLPRTDSPGALDAGVDSFIAEIVSNYFSPEDREVFLQGLGRLSERSQRRFAASFSNCTKPEQTSLAAELDELAFPEPGDSESTDPDSPDESTNESADESTDRELTETDRRFFRFHKELTVVGFYTSEVGQTQELRESTYGEFRSDIELTADQKAWA